MTKKKETGKAREEESSYLDIQAEVGITKHYGGYNASDTLYALCHLEAAKEVLEVGCGVGVGPAYIAKRYGCRVMAVDISEKMLDWARKRARKAGVSELITFRQADILELPFEDGRFDAVIVESVLVFVENKKKAVQEVMRVTKTGGYVGINESFWRESVPQEVVEKSVYESINIATEAELKQLWEEIPLEDKTIKTYSLDAKQEVRDRFKWIGCSGLLTAWARAIKLVLTNKGARDAIKQQMDVPDGVAENYSYGPCTAGGKKGNDRQIYW